MAASARGFEEAASAESSFDMGSSTPHRLGSMSARAPPTSLQLVIHSAALGDAIREDGITHVWIVSELAGGRLLSSTTARVAVPPRGMPAAFNASVTRLPLDGANAAELTRLLHSSDWSDSDLIFSLHGAGSRGSLYLGEAYVNLLEMLRTRADVAPHAPLTLVGSSVDEQDIFESMRLSNRPSSKPASNNTLALTDRPACSTVPRERSWLAQR